jgi:hypothetical protein
MLPRNPSSKREKGEQKKPQSKARSMAQSMAKATLKHGKEGRDKPGGTVLMRRERG